MVTQAFADTPDQQPPVAGMSWNGPIASRASRQLASGDEALHMC
jgi:hypothetical protein